MTEKRVVKGPYRLTAELGREIESRALVSATKTETEVIELALRSHFEMDDQECDYTPGFERMWSRRERSGTEEKKSRTYKMYLARIGEGGQYADIKSGMERYSRYCSVMMVKSDYFKPMPMIEFLSESKPYLKSWVTF